MDLQGRAAVVRRELDGLVAEAVREREERLRGLQLAARSLRQAESVVQWVEILADAAAPMAEGVAFFRVDGETARCEAVRGMAAAGEVPLAAAPALRQAVDTKETVVTLFAASQLSVAVTGPWRRAHLFPLTGRTRVMGVLLAAGEAAPDVYGLEVLLSVAASSLELRETKSAGLVGVMAAAPVIPVAVAPARQFARARVARWMLEESERVSAGRARRDVYGTLRDRIEGARGEFAARYLPGPDELHLEMVAQLARGDAGCMGKDYPGPLTKGE